MSAGIDAEQGLWLYLPTTRQFLVDVMVKGPKTIQVEDMPQWGRKPGDKKAIVMATSALDAAAQSPACFWDCLASFCNCWLRSIHDAGGALCEVHAVNG